MVKKSFSASRNDFLCLYRGGSQGLSPTYEQAHVGERPCDPGIMYIKEYIHNNSNT